MRGPSPGRACPRRSRTEQGRLRRVQPLVRQRGLDLGDVEREVLSNDLDRLARIDGLGQRLGTDAAHRRRSERLLGIDHDHRITTRRVDTLGPLIAFGRELDPLEKRLSRVRQQQLPTRDGYNHAQRRRDFRFVLDLQDETAPLPHERPEMGQRVGHAELAPQPLDHRAKLLERNISVAIRAEVAGLDELAPRDLAGTGGLRPDHRRIGLPAVLLTTFEPPRQRRSRHTQVTSCLGDRVELAVEHGDAQLWPPSLPEVYGAGTSPTVDRRDRAALRVRPPPTPPPLLSRSPSRSAASRSDASTNALYTLSVVAAFACPRRPLTVRTGTPPAISRVATK